MSENLYTRLAGPLSQAAAPFLRDAEGHTLSYAELHRYTARLANTLIALGVKPGDRVAAQVEKSPEAIVLYLAALRAGAAFLPLNTAYTLAEMEYFIGDAEPSVLVCAPEKLRGLRPLAERFGVGSIHTMGADGVAGSMLSLAKNHPEEFVDVPRASDDLAAILYTSGTTGRSKGAMLTHGNLLSNAGVLRQCWHYTAADVLLHALPIFHIHGLFVAVNITLAAGASMVLLPRFDADLVFAHLAACNVMMGVPTFYVRLLQDVRLTQEATAHMRVFVSGSAPLLPETHRAWQVRTGHAILERYGMTETSINASNPYDGERIAGTVGQPLPGVELRIVDAETGKALPPGQVGMIDVRGPNVFAGYWRSPERTQAEFRADGFFITGDLGLIDARGYLQIVGRSKDLIISGGYNVYPREIEMLIDAMPGVGESAVVGLPHADLGEAVTAMVVAPKRPAELTEAAVLQALKQRLAGYKCPKRIVFVPSLPRNTMGKIRKKALRDKFAGLYSDAPRAKP